MITLSTTCLATVLGGINTDAKTTIGNGAVLDRTVKSRTDNAYRLDMIKQACDRKATTVEQGWFSTSEKVDPQKSAACFLEATTPK
jgi:hypothetical protein